MDGATIAKHLRPKDRFKARVIYVDPTRKRVALTVLSHLLSFSLALTPPLLGTTYDDVAITEVVPATGVHVSIPRPPGRPGRGFIHISNLVDD